MERTFKITVDGREYHVTVEEITEGSSVVLPDAGSMQVPRPAAQAPAAPVPTPSAGPKPATVPGDELSPLAGTIATVDVSIGQEVKEGDRIASVEAMKMCTHVIAHHTGKVTRIDVKTGDTVEAGQALMNIA